MKDLSEKTAAFLTLGCKVNQYETDGMMELLSAAGVKIVDFDDSADIYIINTCSVTNIADRKSRQMLHKAKKRNPDAVILACGCYVQAAGEKLLKDDAVDIIIGNNRKKDIVRILTDYLFVGETEDNLVDISEEKTYENFSVAEISSHTRAYIKIQDGCNQFCSYCIIPYVRGRIRSREPSDIIQEITELSHNGIKEIVLTGIHISSYGIDLKNGIELLTLIRLISKIESIERIRLGSLEPGIITEEFVKGLADIDKVCPHFHLSLQSGSETVLKRMNRKYTPKEFMDKCSLIRAYYDRPALTTDIIVGFPGETEGEFRETVNFLEEINFYEMHIFKYSMRGGTAAAAMDGQVPPQVKDERSKILLEMSERHSKEYRRLFESEPVTVLVEEVVSDDGRLYLKGHTERYLDVTIPADGTPEPERYINTLVKAPLTPLRGKDL